MAPLPVGPALEQMATPAIKPAETSLGVKKTDINNTPKAEGKKKNPNWTIKQDKQLCVAWLNTSCIKFLDLVKKV